MTHPTDLREFRKELANVFAKNHDLIKGMDLGTDDIVAEIDSHIESAEKNLIEQLIDDGTIKHKAEYAPLRMGDVI